MALICCCLASSSPRILAAFFVVVVVAESHIDALVEAVTASHAKLKHVKLTGSPRESLRGLLEATTDSLEVLDMSGSWATEEGLGLLGEWLMSGPQSIREVLVNGGEDEWPEGEAMAEAMSEGSAPMHHTPSMTKVEFNRVVLTGRPAEMLADR